MGSSITKNVEQPIINTTHGQVRGQLRETVYGDKYYCFDGIPYAKPPLGELRFKSPQPIEPWSDVRDCTVVAPKCIQYNRYTDRVEGSEDCLYLNIYVKKLKSEKPLPVMVYIHGGVFATGSASRLAWGPDYFMMKDVVLVTIGYRLGALGFLSLPEPELQVPGNAGLKDIVMALQWLKQNYINFNGDPDNVTLFGNSSGSSCTHILTTTPQCKDLFHKAILMSGVFLHLREIPSVHFHFAKHVGYEGAENNKDILNYLNSIEAEKLCKLNFLKEEESNPNMAIPFAPVKENTSVPDALITKDPFEVFADEKAWFNNKPLMLGATSFESLARYQFFTTHPELFEILKLHPEKLLSYETASSCDLATQQQLARKLIKLHLGEKEMNLENLMNVLHLKSHDFMYHPIHRYISVRIVRAQAPTYLYRFDFDSPDFNFYRIKNCGRQVRGVAHADELSYVFYIPQSFKLARDSEEFNTILLMMDILTSFAAKSDPNTDQIKPIIWQPVASYEERKCLNISNKITHIDWPELEKCKMWDKYFQEAGLMLF